MKTIKQWYEEGADVRDQIKFGITQYRTPESSYMFQICDPVVKNLKNREGYSIYFQVPWLKHTEGAEPQVWKRECSLLLFKFPYGYKGQWRLKTGKKERIVWGPTPTKEVTDHLFGPSRMHRDATIQFRTKWEHVLDDILSIEDMFPIAKYMHVDIDERLSQILTQIDIQSMSALVSGPGTKHVLQFSYNKLGDKRITKNSFGGVGEIRDFDQLLYLNRVVRVFRDCQPHVLENPKLKKTIRCIDNPSDLRYIIGFFKQSPKAIEMVITHLNKQTAELKRQGDYYGYEMVSDTVRSLRQIRSHRTRNAIRDLLRRNPDITLQQLHDFASAELNKLKQQDRVISREGLKKYNNVVLREDVRTVIPKSTHEMVGWGAEYNICIGAYGDDVIAGHSDIFAIQKPDGSYWGFADIEGKKLHQMLGKHNQPLPRDVQILVEDWLSSIGINVSSYWGRG